MGFLIGAHGSLLGLLLFIGFGLTAQTVQLQGRILDTAGKALAFGTVTETRLEESVTARPDGSFVLELPAIAEAYHLEISYVGKQTRTMIIPRADVAKPLRVILYDLSLKLQDVEVTGVRRGKLSASSIVYTREALEQMQAFSLADVLNNLPGKSVGAPDLQNPQTLTLRTSANGEYAMNNSLGAAVIVDDVRLSNDANMQGRNLSTWGMSGSVVSNSSYGSFDVPFTGIDLRDIPVDNIETIEVVTGVAPAQYGELTSGAVVIKRQAGKTRWQFNTRINGGSTEFSLGKGFSLGKKWGALNFNTSYLNSNSDPRDKVKSYNRLSGNLMWTDYFADQLKNTFSVDVSTNLDDVKQDPDDDSRRMTYSKSRNIRLSNRTNLSFKRSVFESVNLTLSWEQGYDETYNQWLLNGPPKALANKDTTGVYEGIFLPGAYLAEERIVGKPVGASAALSTSLKFNTGSISQTISVGGDLSYSDNRGGGIVVDPERPRWININSQNERPYNYDTMVPALVNLGFYLQDNTIFRVADRDLTTTLGLRYGIQNGFGNLQPRVSFRYALTPRVNLNLSYGIATKSPTLAHRYPSPAWLDIPLLTLYTGNADQSLFLVYTQKIVTANQDLRPSRSATTEAGVDYSGHAWGTSLFAYYRKERDGFSSYSQFEPLLLPDYGYTYTAGEPIEWYPTGDSTLYAATDLYVITNGKRSDNYGIEWMMQVHKIPAIQTSFNMNTSFSYSHYWETDRRMIQADVSNLTNGGVAVYGVYNPVDYSGWTLTSRLGSSTHLSKLGFVVSLSADIAWIKGRKTKEGNGVPIGYVDKDLKYYEIEKFNAADPATGYLLLSNDDDQESSQPFVYGNLSMRIAKELKDRVTVAVNIYNVLNARAESYNPQTESSVFYNSPTSITAGVSLKF